jgi:hypothetical protein
LVELRDSDCEKRTGEPPWFLGGMALSLLLGLPWLCMMCDWP